ncbi:spermatogenesis-associated protein 4 [Gastrophryne carolinensis]
MPSYAEAPSRSDMPQEVLRWLQALNLRSSPTNFRRDFSNGCIIAEICSWYYPEDIQLHSYCNGTSLATKLSNWSQLEKFFLKRKLNGSKELIDGTIHCKPGAAEILLQEIYVLLTNKRIKSIQDDEVDFTDRHYQDKLPMVARSTASKAVKSNITLSETLAEPDISVNQQKVQAILDLHGQQRQQERIEDPKRFGVKPSLGKRAIRQLPPPDRTGCENIQNKRSSSVSSSVSSKSDIQSKTNVNFKEIKVKQGNRIEMYRLV